MRRMIHAGAVLLCAALWLGCGESDPSCPTQVMTLDGARIPDFGHGHSQLSPDGTKLAYEVENGATVRVLTLKTGHQQTLDIQGKLPSTVRLIGAGQTLWCPYDNDRLLIHCSTFTDTVGSGHPSTYGQNIYEITLSTGELRRVTPSMYGKAGSEHGIYIYGWLQGSMPEIDSLLGGFSPIILPHEEGIIPTRVYIPQSDTFGPPQYEGFRDQNVARDIITLSGYDPASLYLNGRLLPLPSPIAGVAQVSWSPSGKLLSVDVVSATGQTQVWILDIDRYQREHLSTVPVRKIDFQQSFCTYSMWGVWGEFLSENTLAVSMHKDGAEASYLWEITVDGDIVRQLTFQL